MIMVAQAPVMVLVTELAVLLVLQVAHLLVEAVAIVDVQVTINTDKNF